MIFEQGVYVIGHDPEKTRRFYTRAPETVCDCSGCRNFRAAVDQMSGALRTFLEQFGIDPAKPAEMSTLCARGTDELLYDGFYHFSGEIRKGLEPFIQTGPKQFRLDEHYILSLGEDRLWFGSECDLLDPEFPQPAVQLNVTFFLPWVLEEKNTDR